ncbi:MAG: pyridoxine 5'-phosphate synthase, partial [Pseudomonadota bacterium]
KYLSEYVKLFKQNGIKISLFIDADKEQIEAAKQVGADIIELHTGKYCEEKNQEELQKIIDSAKYASEIGLECHAGHGLSFDTVPAIAKIPQIVELNIGHFIIAESIFIGLAECIKEMKRLIGKAC